jgi:hypothetical protein
MGSFQWDKYENMKKMHGGAFSTDAQFINGIA